MLVGPGPVRDGAGGAAAPGLTILAPHGNLIYFRQKYKERQSRTGYGSQFFMCVKIF